MRDRRTLSGKIPRGRLPVNPYLILDSRSYKLVARVKPLYFNVIPLFLYAGFFIKPDFIKKMSAGLKIIEFFSAGMKNSGNHQKNNLFSYSSMGQRFIARSVERL